jgi:hypothetical protein
MKKIVTIMCIMLMSVMTLTGKNRDRYHFIVEGEFLADKNISYTIFQQDQTGKFVAIEHVKSRKYFLVECNTGHKYIVRFQNKKGDVKFLMIDAVERGYFMVDVDWSKPYDGKITLEKTGYALTPFTNIPRSALIAQN